MGVGRGIESSSVHLLAIFITAVKKKGKKLVRLFHRNYDFASM